MIGTSNVDMDLTNSNYISHQKLALLLDEGNNIFFSTLQHHDFVMTVNYFDNQNSGKNILIMETGSS